MSDDRNDQGEFTETVTLAEVLSVFDAVDGPVVTSGDVTDRTGCSPESARRKLDELEDLGQVESRTSAGPILYWRTDAGVPTPVEPDDPIFTDRPMFASGHGDLSNRVDDLLYGAMSQGDI